MPAFILYLVLSCLTCLVMINVPSLIFIFALIWGVFLILIGLETNKLKLSAAFALNILLIWAGSGSSTILIYAFFVGLPALVMGYIITETNRGYYDVLKAGLATAIITGVLLIGFIYIDTDTAKQFNTKIDNYIKANLESYERSGIFELYDQQGIEKSQIEASFYKTAQAIVKHLPALYLLQAILLIVFTLYFASRLARYRGIHRLDKLPFTCEMMPWQIAWLVIGGLLFWLMGESGSNLQLVGSNVLTVLAPISAFFGLSVIAYKLNLLKPSSKRRGILILVILIIFLTIPAFIFLALLGLFDSLLDYRKLRTDKEVPL
ncbi:MAG TPA: DUF2232 domain-containing protein [Syntrophomonadaceae bacterium]|nr:DUF2232 domain-containing protein [Syntrophomonadaceae bacterium]